MANYSFSRNNNKGLKVFAVIVTILLVAALVVGLFFIGKTTNGFTEMPTFDDDEIVEDEDGGLLISQGDSSESDDPDSGAAGISVVMTFSLIQSCDYADYGINPFSLSAYEVHANVTPSNADIKDFSWSLEIADDYDGYDGNGQVWSPLPSIVASDYLKLSSENQSYCYVSCDAPFGCTMKLVYSISDKRGNSFSASCNLDYKSYVYSQKISVSNVGTPYSDDLFNMIYYVGTRFSSNSSVVSVDMDHIVNSTSYVFTVTPGDIEYTVGSLPCEETLPSYSFEMSYGAKTSSSSSWSSITEDLFGTALGNGYIGDLTHEIFDNYDSSNPMVTLKFTSSESLTFEIGLYFINTDCLPIPIDSVHLDTDQIIFG